MRFRAVLFDVGDTLWHSRAAPTSGEFRRLATLRAAEELRSLGLSHDDPALVARTTWDAMETARRHARLTDCVEPDCGLVCRDALKRLGLDVTREAAARILEATYISGSEGGKAAFPNARQTLLELRRRGLLLGVVTNRAFGGERFRADLREAGLDVAWDAEAVSSEVGYLKPHPAIFAHALNLLRIPPKQAVMVGDSLADDIGGAQAVGMSAAWRRCLPDTEGVCPDFSFDEIGDLLGWPALQGEH